MKKRLLATIMTLTMAMGFVACGADQTSQTENTSDTAEATESTESAESDVAYIQEKGKLIVGITDFAPMVALMLIWQRQ